MERRAESRLLVEAPGHYRSDGQRARHIFFSQISPNGCRLSEYDSPLAPGDRIALHLGPIGPIDAVVRWRRDNMAGVQFDAPLEPAIVDFFAVYCERAA